MATIKNKQFYFSAVKLFVFLLVNITSLNIVFGQSVTEVPAALDANDIDKHVNPAEYCSHAFVGGDAMAKSNIERHSCNNEIKVDPLSGFFAYTCTCPTIDERLGRLREIEKKYKDLYEKYTSGNADPSLRDSEKIAENLILNDGEVEKCLNEFPEYISTERIIDVSNQNCNNSESKECKYIELVEICEASFLGSEDNQDKINQCQFFSKCSIYKKNKSAFQSNCESRCLKGITDMVELSVCVSGNGVQVSKLSLAEILKRVGEKNWEQRIRKWGDASINSDDLSDIKKVCESGEGLWPVSYEIKKLVKKYSGKKITPVIIYSDRMYWAGSTQTHTPPDEINNEIFYGLHGLSQMAVEKLYEVNGDDLDSGVKFVESEFITARNQVRDFVENIIKESNFSPEKSKALLDKIESVNLQKCKGPSMAKLAKGSYLPSENAICFSAPFMEVGKLYPETLRMFLLHEFGHMVHNELSDSKVFDEADANSLASCLRGAGSVNALFLKSQGSIKDDTYVPAVDQMGEAFSDWFAIEVFAKGVGSIASKRQYQNFGLRFCESGALERSSLALTDPHPTGPDRINKVFAVHPVVRKAYGKSPLTESDSLKYCSPPEVW